MKDRMIFSEWKKMLTNKKILIPVIAVICVPILYAGMFLWAFWDPYDHLQDLPVAVVNEDEGANYENEQLQLGDELVDKLKDLDEFGFEFVSKKKAFQALENEEYYMVVEIPKEFSKNATTLMDEHPKKLTLNYVPNESYNFLSSQIGETAMNEIKAAISKEVTATYAETVFDNVETMANGFKQASDGAEELDGGASELKDGNQQLEKSLRLFADQSIEFQAGMTNADEGTKTLTAGTSELQTGLHQLTDANGELLQASGQVEKGASDLQAGITAANNGVQTISKNIPELQAGTEQVANGLGQLQQELPSQLAGSIQQQLNEQTNQLFAGMNQLENELTKQLSAGIGEQIAGQQEQQMNQLFEVLLANGVDPALVNQIKEQIATKIPSKDEQIAQLEQGIGAGLQTGFSTFRSEAEQKLSNATAGLPDQIQAGTASSFDQLLAGLGAIQDGQHALNKGMADLQSGMEELTTGSSQLVSGQHTYQQSMSLFNQKLKEAATGSNELTAGAVALNSGMNQLSDATGKLVTGADQLAAGSTDLAEGSVALKDGMNELHQKLGEAADEAGAVEANQETYDMMGEPVLVEKNEINEVPNYGTGFAPYFISLGLFVGSLLITIVYPLYEPAMKPKNGWSWFLGKFSVLTVVGIFQALLVDAILIFGLGLEVQSLPLFILVSILTSLTFMTLIQFLVTWFGDPGRFVAILILIMQLTTSAGTFPLELIPKVLQPVNAVLPMTYTVQAFKAVISSGNWDALMSPFTYLLGSIALCSLLTLSYFLLKNKKWSVNPVLKQERVSN
ncbi:YhgE/Pip domain-containing protein [Ornithinibacillus gellani]|uniref:YhgE/Pip domain-containing protein n=1 Tax=Ornithinibacillus gellani TaxID=2293253 RepID=UPI000F495059|nr:YhgE/Pip domain-containing protein [Ornithinibacillus gellani]TQS75765.1 YhgE/Pip domain-containing protein [Ornithinibacillus gellani]